MSARAVVLSSRKMVCPWRRDAAASCAIATFSLRSAALRSRTPASRSADGLAVAAPRILVSQPSAARPSRSRCMVIRLTSNSRARSSMRAKPSASTRRLTCSRRAAGPLRSVWRNGTTSLMSAPYRRSGHRPEAATLAGRSPPPRDPLPDAPRSVNLCAVRSARPAEKSRAGRRAVQRSGGRAAGPIACVDPYPRRFSGMSCRQVRHRGHLRPRTSASGAW